MLEIIPVQNINAKRSLFEQYSFEDQTWLVSDLKSKFEIQKKLLGEHKLLPENSVLRASELWRKWLMQLRPTVRLVSSDYIRTFLSEYIRKQEAPWAQTPGASKTLFQYLNQLVPVFLHPEGEQILKEWFENNPKAYVRWGHWYLLAKQAWAEVTQLELCATQWAPALLMQEDLTLITHEHEVIVDLGAELTLLEAELLQRAAQADIKVKVLLPETEWTLNYSDCLCAYELLKGESKDVTLQPLSLLKNDKIAWSKYATETAEVKSTIAKVRKLLDSGVEAQKVCIVAPDIEKLWPVLSQYLMVEGIPVNKPFVSKASSFSEVVSWLSRLQVYTGQLKSSCLESDLYSDEENCPIPYEQYKVLFSNIFSDLDIRRHRFVEESYKTTINPEKPLNRDEFIQLSLRYWRKHWQTDRLELLLARLCGECSTEQQLTLKNWLMLVGTIATKIEVLVRPPSTQGLHCENISSLEWIDADYCFVLGATERGLNQSTELGISQADTMSLSSQTGFNLANTKARVNEFDLLFFLTDTIKNIDLSYSATDFRSQVNAPSKVWLVGSLANDAFKKEVDSVDAARWDELQAADIKTWSYEHQWTEETESRFLKSFKRDLGEAYSVPKQLVERLSVSQVERYLECPFKMSAQKVWGLSDLPSLDLDVDRMTTGKLMHALFEKLTIEPIKYEYTEEQLNTIIDECREQEKVILADEKMWEIIRTQYVTLAERFLQFEKIWREEYPDTKTVGRELKISTHWNTEKADFDSTGDFSFIGFVDRIDINSGGDYAVVDYKSSDAQAKNHGGWLKNHSLQLGMYAAAIEAGSTELDPGKVLSSNYFVARSMTRKKGYTVKAEGLNFLPQKTHYQHAISEEGKEKLFEGIKAEFNLAAQKIKAGDYEPSPEKFDLCPSCSWRKICRSSHLNR